MKLDLTGLEQVQVQGFFKIKNLTEGSLSKRCLNSDHYRQFALEINHIFKVVSNKSIPHQQKKLVMKRIKKDCAS